MSPFHPEWTEKLANWRSSGLSIAAWCREILGGGGYFCCRRQRWHSREAAGCDKKGTEHDGEWKASKAAVNLTCSFFPEDAR